jgi:hypothetical protein
MADWVWQYLTFRRGTRLITGESEWIVPPALPSAQTVEETDRTGTLN